jgi:hypothetical protein
MDMGLHDQVSVAAAARKGLGRRVAAGPRSTQFGGFAGSVSASASVQPREAFVTLNRQIPAGCGSSIAADCFATRSLL